MAAILAAAIAASLGVAGHVSAQSPSPSGKVVLRVGNMDSIDNLNPFTGYTALDWEVYHLVYDFLVGYKASDRSPVPELALSWSHSPDGKTWTFKLRPGVRWSDGVPLTAKDVAFTYNYIIKNNLSAFTAYTTYITNAEAVDDLTVVLHLEKPKSTLPQMWVPILPQHIWSKVSGKAATSTYANSPPIVGSGPFRLVSWKQGREATLVANKQYWRGAPRIDELIFETYENANTMTDDLRAGGLDAAVGIPDALFNSLGSASGITRSAARMFTVVSLPFNCYEGSSSLGNPVFRDSAFRRALNWAVEKRAIAEIAYQGHADPVPTMVVPWLPWSWEPPADMKYGFDLNKASALLDAAGYKRGPDGERTNKQGKPIGPLNILVSTVRSQEAASAKLIIGWFKQIGLNVKLSVMDQGAYLDRIYNTNKAGQLAPDYDMALWMDVTYPDPDQVLSWSTTAQIGWWSDVYWSNRDYDALYEQQATAVDKTTRKQMVDKMQEIFYQESPSIPLVSPRVLMAYNTGKWEGWVQSPAGSGAVVWLMDNIDTYLKVHPKSAVAGASTSRVGVIIGAIVVVVVAIGMIVWYVVRRRRPQEVE